MSLHAMPVAAAPRARRWTAAQDFLPAPALRCGPLFPTRPGFEPGLRLRASCDPLAGPQAQPEPAIPARAPGRLLSAGPSLRVLVAEDHDINQRLVLALLERMGASARLVIDGEEAVAEIRRAHAQDEQYDLVLMDIQMPRLDGLEAARRIRAEGIDSGTLPIVAVSANAYPEDIEACLASGMQAHLAKPLRIDGLTRVLRQWGGTGEPRRVERPALDPAVEALRPKFKQLCADCAGAADRLRAALPGPDAEQLAAFAGKCHRLAGTAQFFGMGVLGEAARAIEDAIEHRAGIAELTKLLDRFGRELP